MDPGTLRLTLALASAFKEGDRSVVGEADDRVREDARRALLATTIGDVHATALIDDRVGSCFGAHATGDSMPNSGFLPSDGFAKRCTHECSGLAHRLRLWARR
jgi:hypothetical protein